jgi:hypothetical protein
MELYSTCQKHRPDYIILSGVLLFLATLIFGSIEVNPRA